MTNELERIWKETVVAYMEVRSWHVPQGTEGNPRKTSTRIADNPAMIRKTPSPEGKSSQLPLQLSFPSLQWHWLPDSTQLRCHYEYCAKYTNTRTRLLVLCLWHAHILCKKALNTNGKADIPTAVLFSLTYPQAYLDGWGARDTNVCPRVFLPKNRFIWLLS
jgi:hypothetical protein